MKFSESLILRIKRYYKKKYNISVSTEEVNDYLKNLANLFQLYKIKK